MEGALYRCGPVVLRGTHSLPEATLVRRLTEPYPPAEAVQPVFSEVENARVEAWLDQNGQHVELSPAAWKVGQRAVAGSPRRFRRVSASRGPSSR